jgi:hypothetical protein
MRSGTDFLNGRVVLAALFACNEFTFHNLKSLKLDAQYSGNSVKDGAVEWMAIEKEGYWRDGG